jgi:ketosteroid isomerase-like protein
MKTISAIAAAALVAACTMTAPLLASDKDKDASVAMAIAHMESQWAAAQKDGKADVIKPMLADGFVTTDVDGSMATKEKMLSTMKAGQWEVYEISDVKVVVYGNTAIATGAWAGKGTDSDGAKVDRRERWTDTWLKVGSNWQCIASHSSPLTK